MARVTWGSWFPELLEFPGFQNLQLPEKKMGLGIPQFPGAHIWNLVVELRFNLRSLHLFHIHRSLCVQLLASLPTELKRREFEEPNIFLKTIRGTVILKQGFPMQQKKPSGFFVTG